MPKPKVPAKLKLIQGTAQPCRMDSPAVELPVTHEAPKAPDWLPNAHAVNEWNRLATILHNVGLLTEAGLSALGMLCALHGKLVQLWSAGESPTGHMLAQYRALVNDFGLTPVAQGKVKAGGDEKTSNRFGNNGKRKA
jgi:phage terminase small subunit